MSIGKLWTRVWFRDGNYIDLAVVRILAVGVQLWLVIDQMPLPLNTALEMPDSLYYPLPMLKLFMLPWGWGARPDATMVNLIYWVTVISGFLSLLGLRTNFSLFVFAIGNLFLQAFIYGFGDLHHRDEIMMIALFALSLSPSGRVLSLDNLFGKSQNSLLDSSSPTSAKTSPFAFWPLFLLQAFFCLMYLSAVASKFSGAGIGWINGYTLQYYMIQDGMRWGSEIAVWLSQFHEFLFMAQIVVFVFQGTFWLVLIYPKAKWVYVPLGLFFHIFILITLTAPFYTWIVLYAVFIPWSKVFEKLNLRLGNAETAST